MTLLAAFQVLLYRYSGQKDFTVGTIIANRNRVEIEDLIGFFVNTLVLRADLSGKPNFTQLLSRVKESALGAYDHQDLPFERLVEELQPDRELNHTPLFQVMFGLQNTPNQRLELPELNVESIGLDLGTAKFDLTLLFAEDKEGLLGTFEYSTDRFEPARISRMIAHLEVLLKDIVADPGRAIVDLSLLTSAEEHQLLKEWSGLSAQLRTDSCIHQLFERHAELAPARVAVTCGEQSITYGELNARANQLAHYLRAQGVHLESRVGLCTGRSVELVVALLGILKAGGAYVPLDPDYPDERLSFMLADAGVEVLLGSQQYQEKLTRLAQQARIPSALRLVWLDSEWGVIARWSRENLPPTVTPEHLAYVIYTSGSTGKPKGALITHQNVVRLFLATDGWFRFSDRDVWTLFHSYAFDFSVWELWGALIYGGRLVVVPYLVSRSPKAFCELLVRDQITVLNQTPSAFRQLIEAEGANGGNLALRSVVFGGEALDMQSLRPWFDRHGDLQPQLINMYGITETTVHVTYRPLTKKDLDSGSVIGVPIPDLQVYILDERMRPLPIGVPGEMFVGGAGLARGYLNRPELTAERFVPHPFSDEPGARLYKTGDLARFLPGRDIEYLGRIDEQVKIRGFRVELGEIESVLCQHPTVREAVLLAREDTPGDQRLVAYLIADGQASFNVAELRRFLEQELPDYMIPTDFVWLEALPLSPSGKLDRRALPAPDRLRSEMGPAFEVPQTEIEKVLASIWIQLLGIDRLGIHDNFFELGGHSLLATRVMARVQAQLGVELPLRVMFDSPTVAELAAAVEGALIQRHEGKDQPDTEKASDGTTEDIFVFPASFAQQRLWLLEQLEPNSDVYNIPAVFRLRGKLAVHALERCLKEVVRRHESLRTTFTSRDGQPFQVVHAASTPWFVLVDFSGFPQNQREAEAVCRVTEEVRRPFDLCQGPLLRALLCRLTDQDHILLLTMHHIISDGWSMRVIEQEMAALYASFSAGEPSPLEDLPLQYADFAVWQRDWLNGDVLEKEIDYWRNQLEGVPPLITWPACRPRPEVQSFRGIARAVTVSLEVTQALKSFSRREGVTLFMTLLAAFQILLYGHTNQSDVVVGSPIANRNRPEIEGLVGFFVNTLVLRTRLSTVLTFRELVALVREVCLGAYAHQDLPFDVLVARLNPQRAVSATPLFQVIFSLQNVSSGELALTGLEVTRMSLDRGISKFDLDLGLSEKPGGLRGSLSCARDLFDVAQAESLASQYQKLLERIVANPDEHLAGLLGVAVVPGFSQL
jgi:amino acid adenylation domain-containing protein